MIKKTALALAAISAGVSAQAAEAAKSDLSVTADISYVSDYVFRGVKFAGASVQPSIEAAYGDLYAGAWHSNSISDTNAGFDSETDFYAGYGYKLNDQIKLDAGVTRYTYSGGSSEDTTEIYVGASANVLLSPSLYSYYDFDREATTVEASIGYSLPIDAIHASLDLSGKLGFVSDSGSANDEDYTYGVIGASVPYKLSDNATLTVGVDYVLNDSDSVAKFGGDDNDIVVGKIGLAIGF